MKFKVGDRVAVYGYFAPAEGGSAVMLNGAKGRVFSILPNQSLEVDLDYALAGKYLINPQRIDQVHPKQCRRVKKKPRCRIWVHKTCPSNRDFWRLVKDPAYTTKPTANLEDFSEFVEVVRMK